MPSANRRLDLTRRAERDYLNEIAYIAADDPHAAELVLGRIDHTLQAIRMHPMSGTPGRVPGTREWPVPRTSLTVIYRVRTASIVVVRMLHQRRLYP